MVWVDSETTNRINRCKETTMSKLFFFLMVNIMRHLSVFEETTLSLSQGYSTHDWCGSPSPTFFAYFFSPLQIGSHWCHASFIFTARPKFHPAAGGTFKILGCEFTEFHLEHGLRHFFRPWNTGRPWKMTRNWDLLREVLVKISGNRPVELCDSFWLETIHIHQINRSHLHIISGTNHGYN